MVTSHDVNVGPLSALDIPPPMPNPGIVPFPLLSRPSLLCDPTRMRTLSPEVDVSKSVLPFLCLLRIGEAGTMVVTRVSESDVSKASSLGIITVMFAGDDFPSDVI